MAGVLVLLAATVAGVPAARANELVDIAVPARHGELPKQWVVRYPKGDGPRAKVLLPDDYDPAKSYPLLVLLIGLQSHYSDWSDPGQGEIAKIAKGFPGIIVMPEGGDGWYTDWFNDGRRGSPAWESYVIDEVIPQIQERYRIRPERRWHALAGVSMGGLGTAYLGSRLPGFFGSIAVFSGFVDTQIIPFVPLFQAGISYAGAAQPPTDPFILYGPPGGFYETGHNPARLTANLAHTRVFMTTGDGTPLVQDPGMIVVGLGIVGQSEELGVIHPMSESYAAALRRTGVDLTYDSHPGNHDWNNFRAEFRAAVSWGLFEPVAERPAQWTYDTVATRGPLWDLAFRFDAPPDRMVRFARSGDRLTVGAAGSAVTVTTAGGCELRLGTPGAVDLPARPCTALSMQLTPRMLTAGRSRVVTARVTPPAEGVVVRLGNVRRHTDAQGVARLRVCVGAPGRRQARASAADRLPATTPVRVRGRAKRCR
jgi:S-formylglutathione hydrolase FrmB